VRGLWPDLHQEGIQLRTLAGVMAMAELYARKDGLADRIAGMEAAEDLFALLEETYQASVLRVHRLHILKRFGEAMAEVERRRPPPANDEQRRILYARALREAHDAFVDGSVAVEPFVRRKTPALVNIRRRTG
jgi:nitrogenase-stabilizing/protective protein